MLYLPKNLMMKTFSTFILFEGIPRGWGVKGMQTNSNKFENVH